MTENKYAFKAIILQPLLEYEESLPFSYSSPTSSAFVVMEFSKRVL